MHHFGQLSYIYVLFVIPVYEKKRRPDALHRLIVSASYRLYAPAFLQHAKQAEQFAFHI